MFSSGAYAQCESDVPDYVWLYESYCFQVCPFNLYGVTLEGIGSDDSYVPILTLIPGCNSATSTCEDVQCTPLEVPEEYILGGNSSYPDSWFGSSECLQVWYRWVHDGVWQLSVWSTCEGCFCVYFEDQLDVELASFTAFSGDNSVTLKWETASEVDNDRFEILRDGSLVADVAATNNSSGSTYQWTDNDVRNGTTYSYTLVAVDVNGARDQLRTVEATPNLNSALITEYSLHQNYPNPFNPSTTIGFDLVEPGFVSLGVYNLIGQRVASVVSGEMEAGRHIVTFDAGQLPSGVYVYRIEANNFAAQKKMMLLK
jgi:hypothetical protein